MWIDEGGREREESFQLSYTWDSLSWERTGRLSRPDKHNDNEPVEIDAATVERFIKRVTKHIKAER